jgi:hypothetical protein
MLKKQSFFWASYADLMTSLFFIMLVLFVLTAVILKKQARASEQAIEKINQVVRHCSSLIRIILTMMKNRSGINSI